MSQAPMRSLKQNQSLLSVRGARTHNLKNVSVSIPRDSLVVVTGPSGSGKSSLVFDTIFAEGQRQYLETLSIYARQMLDQLERPDVDEIVGLQPTLCIDQHLGTPNPRSTVGTITEIYDYMRLLFSRCGDVSCPKCGKQINQWTTEQIEADLQKLPERTRLIVLAPMVRNKTGYHGEIIAQIRKAGLLRVRVDGTLMELDQIPRIQTETPHTIEAVIDRILIKPDSQQRLGDAIDLGVQLSGGYLLAAYQLPSSDGKELPWREKSYSTQYACLECNTVVDELEPRSFSFNSPYGACVHCKGLGYLERFDPSMFVVQSGKSPLEGAFVFSKLLSKDKWKGIQAQLEKFFESRNLSTKASWKSLSDFEQNLLLHGESDIEVRNDSDELRESAKAVGISGSFVGVLNLLEQAFVTETDSELLDELSEYRGRVVCSACHGTRLLPAPSRVQLGGRTIGELCSLPLMNVLPVLRDLHWESEREAIGRKIIEEMLPRLQFLCEVGLGYLTLDRAADSLSGGELQRVRLATNIGSGLCGVCYILDEPSIGLHPRDTEKLIACLKRLQSQGNSLLIVEHDEAMMRAADFLIDFGPGAGKHGGVVVGEGDFASLASQTNSQTGPYLSGSRSVQSTMRKAETPTDSDSWLELSHASLHNLKSVDLRLPLSRLVCVTGVSGSGKSSLISETLVPALRKLLGSTIAKPGPHRKLTGWEKINRLVVVDQSPLGRNPRGNAATFTGAFDQIRELFAQTKTAKQFGFRANRFSFNVKGGRCEACLGLGIKKVEMGFLPDMQVVCDECRGRRFNQQTLQVKFRELSIAEVLELSVEDALGFFENVPNVRVILDTMNEVGLGYLTLGQPANTFSGGEAQRVKLAAELARASSEMASVDHTLFVLDEPTLGLHFSDVQRLLTVLQKLVAAGNTVVVIEHNLDLIANSDWIVDIGPDGGAAGGEIVACGSPQEVALNGASITGKFLDLYFKKEKL